MSRVCGVSSFATIAGGLAKELYHGFTYRNGSDLTASVEPHSVTLENGGHVGAFSKENIDELRSQLLDELRNGGASSIGLYDSIGALWVGRIGPEWFDQWTAGGPDRFFRFMATQLRVLRNQGLVKGSRRVTQLWWNGYHRVDEAHWSITATDQA